MSGGAQFIADRALRPPSIARAGRVLPDRDRAAHCCFPTRSPCPAGVLRDGELQHGLHRNHVAVGRCRRGARRRRLRGNGSEPKRHRAPHAVSYAPFAGTAFHRRSRVLAFFERLVDPYPDAQPAPPPRGFFAFLWACSRGLRKYLLATVMLTGAIGAFEALLFAFLGNIVDWLAKVEPAQLWTQEKQRICCCSAACSRRASLLVALQSTIKQQALFGNFPMLLRWNFHRLMLGAEHALLPGRVRRAHRDQGDADRARRARHLAHRRASSSSSSSSTS